MRKPNVLFTRPAYWDQRESKFNLIHCSISPYEDTRLRNGKLCADSVGGVMTDKGADILIKMFEEYKPVAFLWWAHYMNDGSADRLGKLTQVLLKCRQIAPDCKFLYGNGNQQGFPDFNVSRFHENGLVDGILINTRDKREIKMYKSHGIKFVDTLHTFGFDPSEHGQFGDVKPEYDCIFGGSQTMDRKTNRPVKFYPKNPMLGGKYLKSKERFDFIAAVAKRFKLMLLGKGKWPKEFNLKPYQYGQDYYKVFGRAKITLGMYHWDLERYYTKRTIYSLASGRMLIAHYIPGMENDFTKGVHCEWFKTVPEALELIAKYLKDDVARMHVGAAGRARAITNHSWDARLKEFEVILGKVL